MASNWDGNGYNAVQGGHRARYYALCAQMGVKRTPDEDREFLSILVGRPIESRSELSEAEWIMVAEHMKAVQDQV